MTRKMLVVAVVLAAMPTVASGRNATTVRANPATVEIRDMHFNPPVLTITAGTTVTWVNEDGEPHTVTDRGLAFRSAALDAKDSFSYTFARPGQFTYFCTIHPMMVGHIIVESAGKSS
jgi:plastocyanin